MKGARKPRVARAIRENLSDLISSELSDPRLRSAGLVSINHVDLNADLSVATVYVSMYGAESAIAAAAVEALGAAAGRLRGPLGRRMNMGRCPQLRFVHDTSGEFSQKVTDIVRDDDSRADLLARAADMLRDADPILLTCHLGPDGDSVGSMVALASMLRSAGKRATLYCPDLVPRNLKWLPHTKTFVQKLRKDAKYALTVVVDCGDPKLLGKGFPKPEVTGDVVVLDHHAAGRPFGDLFVCDPEASAVGVLVARIAQRNGWPIDDAAAKGLFVSLTSDTGSFRYSNTNAEAFRLAADLVEREVVSPWEVSERMSEQVPLSKYRLLSKVLDGLELAVDGKVAFITITAQMLKDAKATWDDTDGMINYARALKGVDCGVLISPAKRGGVRVSMRSKGHLIDAGQVCYDLGGGGHRGAAGCTLEGADLAVARKTVETALERAVSEALGEEE